MPVSHPSSERVLTISLFTSEKICVLKTEIHEQKQKCCICCIFSLYLRKSMWGRVMGGNPSNDFPIPGTMAYFKRCIEERANVIATASLPESSH